MKQSVIFTVAAIVRTTKSVTVEFYGTDDTMLLCQPVISATEPVDNTSQLFSSLQEIRSIPQRTCHTHT